MKVPVLSTTGPLGRVSVTDEDRKPLGVARTAGAEPRKVATPEWSKSKEREMEKARERTW